MNNVTDEGRFHGSIVPILHAERQGKKMFGAKDFVFSTRGSRIASPWSREGERDVFSRGAFSRIVTQKSQEQGSSGK